MIRIKEKENGIIGKIRITSFTISASLLKFKCHSQIKILKFVLRLMKISPKITYFKQRLIFVYLTLVYMIFDSAAKIFHNQTLDCRTHDLSMFSLHDFTHILYTDIVELNTV